MCEIDTYLGHKGVAWCAAITGNCQLAVTGAQNVEYLWEARTGLLKGTLEHTPDLHVSCAVRSVAISSSLDGNEGGGTIVTGSSGKENHLLNIFDAERPDKCVLPMRGHQGIIRRVTFLPDDWSTVFSVSEDKTLREPTQMYQTHLVL